MHNTFKEDSYKSFQKIMDLNDGRFSVFASDYSYWDEMLNFVETKDLEWAKINIDDPMKNFELDYVWIVDANSQFIYNVNGISLFLWGIDIISNNNIYDSVVLNCNYNHVFQNNIIESSCIYTSTLSNVNFINHNENKHTLSNEDDLLDLKLPPV